MKRLHRILLAAAGGTIILALVWPRLDYGIYVTDTEKLFGDIFAILLAVLGAVLVSYALHEIHPALVPLGWVMVFLGNLTAFLAGNSDGFGADLAMVILAGIPGMVLTIVSIRMYLNGRRQSDQRLK